MNDSLQIRQDCPECGGSGEVGFGPEPEDYGKCHTCHGTGKVPIIYTPEKFIAAGHELHDDVAVWAYHYFKVDCAVWELIRYRDSLRDRKIIIATPAITREVLESLG